MSYVVLVEPEGSANIGSIARVMKNFGFDNLVIVNPKCEINLETRKYAMHAWDIVENATILESYDDVFSLDADLFIGTTAKPSASSTRMSITPKELAEKLKTSNLKPAFIFGRESSGLTNKELRKCDLVLHIPTSSKYKAMNLSHAVAVVLYEIFSSTSDDSINNIGLNENTVDRREIDKLLSVFSELANLPEIGLRNPENSVKMFRSVISRSIIRGREAKGIIVVLERALECIKKQ